MGNGQPWGLNRNNGGAHILPPYARSKKTEWYKGTANAICQNIPFIDRYDPEYVLVLSGDHIYKMDYAKMLAYHEKKQAECTIAVLDVPIEEASRFGIMTLNEEGAVTQFEEKPKKPQSTKASMGIYIFNWKLLREYLLADDEDETSANDFGKNIIPNMLADHRKMYGYEFQGYWKDVGTIESLWEANMDLLREEGDPEQLNMKDSEFKIYARNYAQPASFIGKEAKIRHSFIAEGCEIRGRIENSIIFTGCVIEEGAFIRDSVVMPNAVVRRGSELKYAIIGEDVEIGQNARVGDAPEYYDKKDWGIAVVGKGKKVAQNQTVAVKEIY